LCADIGRALGCGGHLNQLRRTASGSLGIEQAVTLDSLKQMESGLRLDNVLIPMNAALGNIPTFVAGPDTLERVAQGRLLTAKQIPRALIQEPAVQSLVDHVKVVDTDLNLKAVLKAHPDGTAYDYCCVFH
jgi:tRNA pseudouridine55 synthase